MNALTLILISLPIVAIAILLLGLKIFFTKDGKFPNIHIGGSNHLKEKGVHCATTQDRNAQKQDKKMNINEIIKEINQ